MQSTDQCTGQMPYLGCLGIPRLPPDCEPKYRHWENGQPLLDTLLELGTSDRAIDMRVTMERSPEVKQVKQVKQT